MIHLNWNRLADVLDQIQGITPFLYAQWLIEDPLTWDYRVIAARAPGDGCYEIAHRAGIIGQTFRTRTAILVADVGSEPFYDPFDARVTWELAIPAFADWGLFGVLNLEGTASVSLDVDTWQSMTETVRIGTGQHLPPSPPTPNVIPRFSTRILTVSSSRRNACESPLPSLAMRLAAEGVCVLMVGDFPRLSPVKPVTLAQTCRNGLPLAGCVRGIGRRIDLLSVRSTVEEREMLMQMRLPHLVRGRYHFVLCEREMIEACAPASRGIVTPFGEDILEVPFDSN